VPHSLAERRKPYANVVQLHDCGVGEERGIVREDDVVRWLLLKLFRSCLAVVTGLRSHAADGPKFIHNPCILSLLVLHQVHSIV
jgi:hypothetical protein